MRTVYLKPITFECHVFQNLNGTLIPYETEFFDGKCDAFVEGYRIVPDGESWKDSNGFVFTGEMIAPWKDYADLDQLQRKYEKQLLTEYQTENTELKAQQNELITSYNKGINSI